MRRYGYLIDRLISHPRTSRALLLAVSLGILVVGSSATAVPSSEDKAAATWLIDLGQRYEYGVGAPQHLDRALELYCEAANLGHPRACFHLGWLYASGRLGAIDEIQAAAWLQAAQAAGHHQATVKLRQLNALDRPLPEPPHCLFTDAITERRLPPINLATSDTSGPGMDMGTNSAPVLNGIQVRELARADIHSLVQRLAPSYQLDPELVLALIQVESNFNPSAHSPKDARGLMQLIPATAQRFGVTDIWDPVQNMRGGMAYLRWLLDHFNGNRKLALAAYNAGEGAVQRHGGIPPYPETQAYVQRIIAQLEPAASSPALGLPQQTTP